MTVRSGRVAGSGRAAALVRSRDVPTDGTRLAAGFRQAGASFTRWSALLPALLAALIWAFPAAAAAPPPQDAGQPAAAEVKRQPAAAEAQKPAAKAEAPKEDVDEEVRLGRRAAAELEREFKLVKDPQQLARLERIGRDLAAVCDEPGYQYTFKIMDTEDTNALSLPGGFIYVTKGMLTFVHSDDELAGVLAHEIAHAARHHVKDLLKREAKVNQNMVIGILGAILLGGGKSDSLGNLLFGAEMVKTAYLTGHTQKAETDADRAGVEYLIKCGKYNPVGALTLIERLARDETRRAGPPLGIFQTHPASKERAAALEGYLRSQNVPINRLAVQDNLRAQARDVSANGTTAAEVSFNGNVVFRTAAGLEAAQGIAEQINRLMQHDLQMRDVKLDAERTAVMAQGEVLFRVTPADAALQGKTPAEVAEAAARNLANGLWKYFMEQAF